MCRKIFAVGDFEMKPLLEGLKLMAEDNNSVHENNHGKQGSFTHFDGWGASFLTDLGWNVVRSVLPCTLDPDFDKLASIKPKAVMLHARQATSGKVHISNSHPFVKDTLFGRVILSHNGSISGLHREGLLGTTDSEAFFSILLDNMIDHDLLKALKKTQQQVRDYTGLNLIINTPEKSYIQVKFKTEPVYYTMKIHSNEKFTVVSSEELKSIATTWDSMKNGDVLIFDHKSEKPTNFIKHETLLPA